MERVVLLLVGRGRLGGGQFPREPLDECVGDASGEGALRKPDG